MHGHHIILYIHCKYKIYILLSLSGLFVCDNEINLKLTKHTSSYNLNPEPAGFLKWNNPASIFGTVHYNIKGYQDENLKVGQPTVQNLVRLH